MNIDFNKNEDQNKTLLSQLTYRLNKVALGGGKKNFARNAGVADRAAALGERELAAARADREREGHCRSRRGVVQPRGDLREALREHRRWLGARGQGLQRGCGEL